MAKYFSDDEFRCHCCGQLPDNGMDTNLINILDNIRERLGRPITVLSGYRCPSMNESCGGCVNSQHLLGTACDITCENFNIDELAQLAEECQADGIGRYPSQEFVHVDTRSGGVGDNYRWEG